MKKLITMFLASSIILSACGQVSNNTNNTKTETSVTETQKVISQKTVSSITAHETGGEDGRDKIWIISQSDGNNTIRITDKRNNNSLIYNISDEDYQNIMSLNFSDYIGEFIIFIMPRGF